MVMKNGFMIVFTNHKMLTMRFDFICNDDKLYKTSTAIESEKIINLIRLLLYW